MQNKEWRTSDKSSWLRGEWDNEPDKMQFTDEATGLPCLIVRNSPGALCGYVGVPEGHKFYGLDYEKCRLKDLPDGEYDADAYVDVHGGLTFAGFCQKWDDEGHGVCHTVDEGENDKVWWLGFDCAHFLDFCPSYEKSFTEGQTYKNVDYVKGEIAKLAKQVAEVV